MGFSCSHLINAELGRDLELVEKQKGIEHVKEVHYVYGLYDIIVKIEAQNEDKVKHTVFSKIRNLEYVRSTLTLNVLK